MANQSRPRGFVPIGHTNGSTWNGQTNLYYIPSTDGSVISPGDPVKSAAVSDANGIPGIQKAAGTDTVRGVVVSILVAAPGDVSLVGSNLDLTVMNAPATKTRAYYALVADDPTTIYEAQDDGGGSATVGTIQTYVNKNCTFTVANPTAPASNSASVLNFTSAPTTTNSLNVKLLGMIQRPDNEQAIRAKWRCVFNLHELNNAGTTAI